MSLTDLEEHIYAYYLVHDAAQFQAAPRFYPYGELTMVIADKVQVSTRKFGRKVTAKAGTVAAALLDRLIASGAYSTKQNDFGGSMHQFQGDAYKAFLRSEQDANPIVAQAKDGGPQFWDQAFARLTGQ